MNKSELQVPAWKIRHLIRNRFSKRLQELRVELGYTQLQLAMNAGLDRSFILDMDRGVKEPTISTLDLLATVFSLTLSEFFDGV